MGFVVSRGDDFMERSSSLLEFRNYIFGSSQYGKEILVAPSFDPSHDKFKKASSHRSRIPDACGEANKNLMGLLEVSIRQRMQDWIKL